MAGIPVIGLFSGAGGIELGAHGAGASVRLSAEIDPVACQTLRANPDLHCGVVLESDVTTLTGDALRRHAGLGRREPCVVVGGPPCQPFSKSSYWTDPGHDSRYRRARARGQVGAKPKPITEARPDARRSLVHEFFRLVEEVRAEGFLFENVPSLAHPRNRPLLSELVQRAQQAGYGTRVLHVNAAHYGVPQRRQRLVLLGVRRHEPEAPQPTHSEDLEAAGYALAAVSAGEALRPFQAVEHSEPEETVRGRYADELRQVPPGQNYKALTAWAGHPRPVFEAETRFWNFLLKLSPDLPSWTVQASPGPWVGPFHWTSRRLRVVELAALQGFPIGYHFAGGRRDRVRQIGNAMPPLLAERMLESVLKPLQGNRRRAPVRRTAQAV